MKFMLLHKGDVKGTHESESNSPDKLQLCHPVQIPLKFARLFGKWNMLSGPSETCVTISSECVCGRPVRSARNKRKSQ
jgi:hypothetical protein